jgi:hypothetical protein
MNTRDFVRKIACFDQLSREEVNAVAFAARANISNCLVEASYLEDKYGKDSLKNLLDAEILTEVRDDPRGRMIQLGMGNYP